MFNASKARASSDGILDNPVQDFESEPKSAFGPCGNLRIPCGFYVADGDTLVGKPKRSKVVVQHGKVRDALDGLVKNNPDYEYREDGGVINIFPKKEKKHLEKGTDPLERVIDKVDISSVSSQDAAQMILQASGLPVGGRIQAGGRWHYATVTLKLSNVTLREALNQLVRADGMAVWVLEYNREHKRYSVDIFPWRKGPSLFGAKGKKD